MKDKKGKKIIILILILSLISFVILLYINIKMDKEKNKERDSEYVRLEVVYPMKISEFSKEYGGNVSDEYILEKITEFIYYIVDNKLEIDNLNENQIAEKYEANQENLNNMGIESAEDYKDIIVEIQKLNKGSTEYSYSEFQIDTIKRANGKTTIDLEVKFTNSKPIYFNIAINNDIDQDNKIVKFTATK